MTEPLGPVPVGITNDVVVEVTDAMTPGHVAALVISTPSLVSIIEGACRRAVLPHRGLTEEREVNVEARDDEQRVDQAV